MRILLIRHAEPDYSHDSLTDKGRLEAELLSRRMIQYDIRDFYVSPLGRARETADYTLSRLGRKAEVLPWMAEFRGRCPSPVPGRPDISWDYPPLVWTSFPDALDPVKWIDNPLFDQGNVREIWKETTDGADHLMARYGFRKSGPIWLSEHNTTDTIAIFCHFAISMAFLAYLMDLSPLLLWHRILCLPSSVTEVVTEERVRGQVSFRATKIGDTAHLESAGERRSPAGLFPECYTGIDSTDPAVNGGDFSRNP